MSQFILDKIKEGLPDNAIINRVFTLDENSTCVEFYRSEQLYRVSVEKIDLSTLFNKPIPVYRDDFDEWKSILESVIKKTGIELESGTDYEPVLGKEITLGLNRITILEASLWYKGYIDIQLMEHAEKINNVEDDKLTLSIKNSTDKRIQLILLSTVFNSEERLFIDYGLTPYFQKLIIEKLSQILTSDELLSFKNKLPFAIATELFNDYWSDCAIITLEKNRYIVRFSSKENDLPLLPKASYSVKEETNEVEVAL